MKASQDSKLDDIQGQIKEQLNCGGELKSEMEDRMELWKREVEETLQNLQR